MNVIIIGIIVCLAIVACVLFLPEIKIGKLKFAPYWIVAILGAVAVTLCGSIDAGKLFGGFTTDSAVNPLKILGVFFGMTILSVYLDEAGFFAYLASVAISKAGKNQRKLFTLFYFTVAILTIFTSNDIIVLTFTPFIIYFCNHARISPKPYLVAEFAAANTFSMVLIIGNPTNIYLASGMDFLKYASVMIFPALLTGVAAYFVIWLLFRKDLRAEPQNEGEVVRIKDKPLAAVSLSALAICTVMIAISGYIGLQMWYIALGGAAIVVIFAFVYGIVKREPRTSLNVIKRIPWQLAPFLLSMFIIVSALSAVGATDAIGKILDHGDFNILTYLGSSILSCNVLNNIPMSVLFGAFAKGEAALYATIVGSNLGALLTPLGALAGIMWTNMLKHYDIKFGFGEFVKYGAAIVAVGFFAAAGGLYFALYAL